MKQLLLTALLVFFTATGALAQTRLGLHVTQAELTIWQQRAASGPYKTSGDVSTNSPGDWTRILANGNALVSAPTIDRWDGTGLSVTGTCKTQPNEPGPASDRSLGEKTRDAAFVYLITGTSSYLTVAKNNLLYEAGRPDLDFGNSSIWCIGPVWDTNPFFDIAHWLVKLLFAYDYIRPALVSGPNQDAAAVSTLDTWFLNMGLYWEAVVDQQTSFNYANSRQNNLTDFALSGTGSSGANTLGVRTYCGGPFDNSLSGKYQNRMASFVKLFTQIGVMLNQAGVSTTETARLKTMGKRYVMEYLQFAVMPDGTPLEFERNISDGIPGGAQHGWRYSTDTAASLAMVADALARVGDRSLYDYTTSNGAGSGANSTAGGTKSLSLVHLQLSRYVNQTETGAPRYAKDSTTACSSGGNDTLIGPQLNTSNGEASNRDTFLAQANLYYRSTTGANNVQSEYLRTAAGAAAYPASPETGGYCAYCGPSGEFPGVLFMFGQMEENTANPFFVHKQFYVSPSGTNTTCTSAENSSTPAGPSLTFVFGCMVSGDTLFLRGGTYTVPLHKPDFNGFPPNGTVGAPTFIKNFPGEVAVIKSNQGASAFGLFEFYSTSEHITFDGGANRGIVFDGDTGSTNSGVFEYVMMRIGGAKNIRITNFEARNLPDGGFSSTSAPGADNNEISNGIIHDYYPHLLRGGTACGQTSCWAYPFYWNGTNQLIEKNEFYNIPSYAVHIYCNTGGAECTFPNNVVVRNNIIHDFGSFFVPTTPAGALGPGDPRGTGILLTRGPGNKAYNNIIYNGTTGIATGLGSSNTEVYSNTIYNMQDTFSNGTAGYGIVTGNDTTATFRNNIISNIAHDALRNDIGGNTFSNNLCFSVGVSTNCTTVADPLFVNTAMKDFHLTVSSPAIDQGFALGGIFAVDFDGRARPVGAGWDIGAFEFAGQVRTMSVDSGRSISIDPTRSMKLSPQ